MDPKNLQDSQNPVNKSTNESINIDSTLADLKKDGVEISSGVSEENEFSAAKTDTDTPVEAVEAEVIKKTAPEVKPPVKPLIKLVEERQNTQTGTPVETVYKNDPSIKQLRTFKTDAEEAVRYQGASKVSIAVAEHKKKEESTPIEYENGNKKSHLSLILITLLILIIAGGGLYYWFFMKNGAGLSIFTQNKDEPKISEYISVKTLIPYNKIEAVNIDTSKNTWINIGNLLANANINIGDTYALLPMPIGTTTSIASVTSIFADTEMSDRLKRSLGADYMIGTYWNSKNGPFVIIKNTFFQNAYAGMLEWESNMRNDLIGLIKVNYPEETTVSVNGDIFNDIVVSNVDTRVLKNSAGENILMYAFADRNTIVIATNIETLKHVLDSLLSVRVVQ